MIHKRLAIKHSKRCVALDNVKNGLWKSAWACSVGTVFKDKAGRNERGDTAWIKISCNDPFCPAVLLLNNDDVLKAAGE